MILLVGKYTEKKKTSFQGEGAFCPIQTQI